MKSVLIVYEAAADVPLVDLDGRTPLQAARSSAATGLAKAGVGGLLPACAQGFEDRNEMVPATLMGVPVEDAAQLHRGPLEALGMELPAGPEHMVYCANYVTMLGDQLHFDAIPALSLEETRTLTASLQESWDPETLRLEVLGPNRLLVRIRAGDKDYPAGPSPARAKGADLKDALPIGLKSGLIWDFKKQALALLEVHSINEVRVDLGENPANGIWLWGGGRLPEPGSIPFAGWSGGCMLTWNNLARGLARLAGMQIDDLVNPWIKSDGKAPAFRIAPVVERLRETDRLVVYVEAPMAGGRYGKATDKVWALETLDRHVLAPLREVLEAHRPYRLALAPDAAVATESGRPLAIPLPVIVSGDGIEADEVAHWDEVECRQGALGNVAPETVMGMVGGTS